MNLVGVRTLWTRTVVPQTNKTFAHAYHNLVTNTPRDRAQK
jgi:hypothetical protein